MRVRGRERPASRPTRSSGHPLSAPWHPIRGCHEWSVASVRTGRDRRIRDRSRSDAGPQSTWNVTRLWTRLLCRSSCLTYAQVVPTETTQAPHFLRVRLMTTTYERPKDRSHELIAGTRWTGPDRSGLLKFGRNVGALTPTRESPAGGSRHHH